MEGNGSRRRVLCSKTNLRTRNTVSRDQGLVHSQNTTRLSSAMLGVTFQAVILRTGGSPSHIIREEDMHPYRSGTLYESAVNRKEIEERD